MNIIISGGSKDQQKEKILAICGEEGIEFSENSPDVLIIKPDLSIGIDEAKKIKKFLSQKSWQEKSKKLALILQAELMTEEAQNAILKTLEEPPKNSLIILCTANSANLLPTITSRCQTIALKDNVEIDYDLYWKEWQKLVKATEAEKLKFAQIFTGKKENLKDWLNEMILTLQKKMLSAEKPAHFKNWLKVLLFAKKMLSANVNPQSVIDWTILKI